jgi:hypothetical protein
MSDYCISNLLDKVIAMGLSVKIVCFAIIVFSIIFSGICYFGTGTMDNKGTQIGEEIIEEVVKKETGIDLNAIMSSRHSRDD